MRLCRPQIRRSTQRDAMKKHLDYSFVVGFAAVFIGTFMIGMRFFPDSTPVRIVEIPLRAVEQFFLPGPERLFGKNHVKGDNKKKYPSAKGQSVGLSMNKI